MQSPVLVIMAAGLGSRYGGLKQIAPIDDMGHILIDYSLFDAKRAGFKSVVFVIKEELREEFHAAIGNRVSNHLQVSYAYQRLEDLPPGFNIPEGRVKPWGTAHAILSARQQIDGPFAVINADDFYGATSFANIYKFLCSKADSNHHALVGYPLQNTLTEHGHVSRGVCNVNEQGYLMDVVERTHIEARPDGAAYTEDGENFIPLSADALVSMNLWGFGNGFMKYTEEHFAEYLKDNLPLNPLKCEYFLPYVVNTMLQKGEGTVSVLPTSERWYGVTYAEDMPMVQEAIAKMKAEGVYPNKLW